MSPDQDEFIGSVPSPCVRNCCLDDEKVCLGCFRTIAEICEWHEASDAEKLETLARCRTRYRQRYERLRF